jgi:hypothetical protein
VGRQKKFDRGTTISALSLAFWHKSIEHWKVFPEDLMAEARRKYLTASRSGTAQMAGAGYSRLTQQPRQLRHVGRNPSRLILAEQLGRLISALALLRNALLGASLIKF